MAFLLLLAAANCETIAAIIQAVMLGQLGWGSYAETIVLGQLRWSSYDSVGVNVGLGVIGVIMQGFEPKDSYAWAADKAAMLDQLQLL